MSEIEESGPAFPEDAEVLGQCVAQPDAIPRSPLPSVFNGAWAKPHPTGAKLRRTFLDAQTSPVFLRALAAKKPPTAPPTAWITLAGISATAPCNPMLGMSVSPMK